MQWVLAAGPAYYGGGLSLQAIRDTLVVVLDALDSMVSVAMIIMSYMFFLFAENSDNVLRPRLCKDGARM